MPLEVDDAHCDAPKEAQDEVYETPVSLNNEYVEGNAPPSILYETID